jgi:hypothetical protein
MALTKHGSIESSSVLEIKGSSTRLKTASLDKVGEYKNYRTGQKYLYARVRAISSRVNKNHDGWPSIELAGSKEIFERHQKQSSTGFTVEAKDGDKKYGFATFIGKPIFVDHHNSDPKRARGVIVDAKLIVEPVDSKTASLDPYYSSSDVDPEHLPPTHIELLLEIDAKSFPKFAKAVKDGEIDGFSMGANVERSKCSHCGNIASSPEEYCFHVQSKGATHDLKTADGHRTSKKSYENCFGCQFFELSGVFEPADETALTKEIISSIQKEGDENVHFPHGEYDYQIPERDISNNEISNSIACPTCNGHENPLGPSCPTCQGQGFLTVPNRGDDGATIPNNIDEHEVIPRLDKSIQLGLLGPVHQGTFEDEMKTKTAARKQAENPLPQSMETTAPQEVDTLRQESICPICGSDVQGETCDVCGYVKPPKGFDNPDLDKAKKIDEEMEAGDEVTIPSDENGPPPGEQADPDSQPKKPGSMIQNEQATKGQPTANVKGEMNWTPYVHQKVAGRINQREIPVQVVSKPVSNEPSKETVTSDQSTPVTAAMLTARHLIAKAQGENMSQRNAQGPSPDDASPTTRVDVIGVGGVDQADNAAASKADAQIDVTGIGTTGVSDVEADKTEEIPSTKTDNAGFDTTKNQEDSGPTSTFGDSDGTQKGVTSPVTSEPFPASNEGVKSKVAYEDGVGDLQDIKPGSANQGTQPSDPIGKAGDRVDVLQAVNSPSNNSGPTTTWSGTDGNKIYKQQDPVTKEVTKSDGVTAHFINAIKLADTEVEMGLIPKDQKYDRIAELEGESPEALEAQTNTLAKVKTASLRQQASRTASAGGVSRLPSLFGKSTAASRGFDHITAGVDSQENQPVDNSVIDSALFTR